MKKRCCKCLKRKDTKKHFHVRRWTTISGQKRIGWQYECKSCQRERTYVRRAKFKADGILNYSQRAQQRLKLECLKAYSKEPCCDCCGEKFLEFLAIDHINGKGHQHRKEIKRSGTSFYLWLRANGFPKGFRVLCHNCNHSYGQYGYCPHKTPDARPIMPPERKYAKKQNHNSTVPVQVKS